MPNLSLHVDTFALLGCLKSCYHKIIIVNTSSNGAFYCLVIVFSFFLRSDRSLEIFPLKLPWILYCQSFLKSWSCFFFPSLSWMFEIYCVEWCTCSLTLKACLHTDKLLRRYILCVLTDNVILRWADEQDLWYHKQIGSLVHWSCGYSKPGVQTHWE